MKCSRPKCRNKGGRGKHGLCETHYLATRHGYVDAEPVKQHYLKLRAAGLSLRLIAQKTGLHRDTLANMGTWTAAGRVEVATADAVMAVPVPHGVVDGGGLVSSVGTRRRLQALMLAGHTTAYLGSLMGVSAESLRSYMSMKRGMVTAATAANVRQICAQLWDKPGASRITARRAAANGWLPFAAWDDIDDPDETPDMGTDRRLHFVERIAELEYLNIPRSQMPRWLGVQDESFERQLQRHGLKEAV